MRNSREASALKLNGHVCHVIASGHAVGQVFLLNSPVRMLSLIAEIRRPPAIELPIRHLESIEKEIKMLVY